MFAVAITLLVFDLKVPQPPAGETFSVATLGLALLNQWPFYLAFLTSFATILIMWVSHHSIFKLVYKSNTPFLFANGFLLLVVTVVPFPTSLVAEYLNKPAAAMACAVYAGIFVVVNIAYNVLWWTVRRHRYLLRPEISAAQVNLSTRNALLGLPLYVVATVVAFLNPYVSVGICSALWIFWAFAFYDDSHQQSDVKAA
ncbi:MAG TPA: TMEM175 family protein [Ktedonobacteraceae bacterium]|nr:TMEM175 family protein [Ktedonobacteraceae bacterium]